MIEPFPDGLFEPLAEPGDDVNKNQLAGFIHSIHFPHHAFEEFYFTLAGMVVSRRFSTLAK